jgi:hypothetical protein
MLSLPSASSGCGRGERNGDLKVVLWRAQAAKGKKTLGWRALNLEAPENRDIPQNPA